MKDIFGYELEAFLEIPARFRGLQAGCPMAEAFRPSYRWGRTFLEHLLPVAPKCSLADQGGTQGN